MNLFRYRLKKSQEKRHNVILSYKKNIIDAQEALVTCRDIISRYDVDMQLTNCEFTLDKAKVIFMYTSDVRVDLENY